MAFRLFIAGIALSALTIGCKNNTASRPAESIPVAESQNASEQGSKLVKLFGDAAATQDSSQKRQILNEVKTYLQNKTSSEIEKSSLGTLRYRDILSDLLEMARSERQNLAPTTSTTFQSLLDEIIDVLAAIYEELLAEVQDRRFIIGSASCGTLEISNLTVADHCDEVRRIEQCVRRSCTAPSKIVLCSEDPTLPVCGLQSDVCGVPAGGCIPKGKTPQEVQAEIDSEHDKDNK